MRGREGRERYSMLNSSFHTGVDIHFHHPPCLDYTRDCSQEWLTEKMERGEAAKYVQTASDFRAVSASDTDYLLGTHQVLFTILLEVPKPHP